MAPDDPLLFARVAGRRVALPVAAVAAVLALPRLQRPAGTPDPVIGFADIGGRATPVLAPLALLEGAAPAAPALDAHLLVMAAGPLALLVDRAEGVERVPAAACRPLPPEESANGCIAALIGEGAGAAALIDPARLLVAAERRRLAALAAALDARLAAAAP